MFKHLLIGFAFLLVTLQGFSQSNDAPKKKEFFTDGHGGIAFQIATLKQSPSFVFGGYGGSYILDRFFIGGGGFNQINKIDVTENGQALKMDMSYGGSMFGYRFFKKKKIDIQATMLIAWGNVSVEDPTEPGSREGQTVNLLESFIRTHIQLTDWFKLGLASGYRTGRTLKSGAIRNRDLVSPFAQVSLIFGSF